MIDVELKCDGKIVQSLSFCASATLVIQTDRYTMVLYSQKQDSDLETLFRRVDMVISGMSEAVNATAMRTLRAIVTKWHAYFSQESIDDPEEAWPELMDDFETLAALLHPIGGEEA